LKSFKNWKIGTRLSLGFGVVLALITTMLVLALTQLASVGSLGDQIVSEDWVKADAAGKLDAYTRANGQRTMELFFAADKTQTDSIRARIASNKKIVATSLDTLERLVASSDGKSLLTKIKEARASYVESFSRVEKLLEEGNRDQATRVLVEETLPRLEALKGHVVALSDRQTKLVKVKGAAIRGSINDAREAMLATGLAALLVSTMFAWWLTRSITVPIQQAVDVAQTVATGDLTSHIEINSSDETGQLLSALKTMNDHLVSVVGTVRRSSESIASASAQIAAGNTDLSQRTEEQAANLEQTAASMEEISSTVKNNSDVARHATELASTASSAVARGGKAVHQVVDTMETIAASSLQIENIIGVIDSIAFQTNILALNAAVEAARAGEQGRGFAVVASEVRGLAQRSAAAAKEIKDLIADSVEKVRSGSIQASTAGETMGDIVAQVQRVSNLISEISAATIEQSSGINQVGDAVSQLDNVTQQNAALVEESAAAADSLNQQAARLVETVGTFRLA
jgi:methyl-accepting chemotaxis protein